ncbi:MAG TPA: hypothetical protein VK846_05675 [Candidatus Limnocylindria bacterium]|nr:hypothetical protein [Candidatus Limnocylindria bacterium]
MFAGAANAADRKMEARLIWGTNEDKSPDPNHKPLDGELAKKLRDMPLKWKNFFEVNRQVFTINTNAYTTVVMSKQCSVEVKNKGANNVTVKLYGHGKQVNRVDKPLPKGEILTLGGDAKDNNAWFITVCPVNGDSKSLEQKKDSSPALAKPAAK